jgi:hypothetical protein
MAFINSNDQISPNEGEQSERFLVEVDENGSLKLRQQSFARGIGWYNQKSLNLTEEEALALIGELQNGVANAKMQRTSRRNSSLSENSLSETSHPTPLAFPVGKTANESSASGLEKTPQNILQFNKRKGA